MVKGTEWEQEKKKFEEWQDELRRVDEEDEVGREVMRQMEEQILRVKRRRGEYDRIAGAWVEEVERKK